MGQLRYVSDFRICTKKLTTVKLFKGRDGHEPDQGGGQLPRDQVADQLWGGGVERRSIRKGTMIEIYTAMEGGKIVPSRKKHRTLKKHRNANKKLIIQTKNNLGFFI